MYSCDVCTSAIELYVTCMAVHVFHALMYAFPCCTSGTSATPWSKGSLCGTSGMLPCECQRGAHPCPVVCMRHTSHAWSVACCHIAHTVSLPHHSSSLIITHITNITHHHSHHSSSLIITHHHTSSLVITPFIITHITSLIITRITHHHSHHITHHSHHSHNIT